MVIPKILVIEDDPVIRDLFIAALRREPLVLHTASDGLDALEKVRVVSYDVILVDLMMPRMNGIDFISAYASLPNANAVIIVVTAFDQAAVIRLAPDISSRVHAVIHKPFDVGAIVELLRECAWSKAGTMPSDDGDSLREPACPPLS